MKRVEAACIEQILHFELKDDLGHDYAIQMVNAEVSRYKKQREDSGAKYRIISENTLDDGSVRMEIKKQYNSSPVGSYLG